MPMNFTLHIMGRRLSRFCFRLGTSDSAMMDVYLQISMPKYLMTLSPHLDVRVPE